MNQALKLLCMSLTVLIIATGADAQRSREFNNTSGRGSGYNNSSTRSAPVRTFNNNDRSVTYRNEERNSVRRMPPDNRVTEARGYNSGYYPSVRNTSRTTTYRDNSIHNSYRYSTTSYYYGNVYGRHTVFMYGPRYRVIPSAFVSINFGGHPYYYHNGYYYGYYYGYYQPIFPPFGLRISVVPFGYTRFFIGINPFFYYNGIYYRQYDDNSYEVIDAPMGATVSSLPKGSRSVVINGEKLYELNGTYYKADRDSKGNDVFIVVGKNGVINNSENNANELDTTLPLQIGDMVSQLPEGSKVVTINGQQLYKTPDNVYLQEQSDNGVTEYKVIGK